MQRATGWPGCSTSPGRRGSAHTVPLSTRRAMAPSSYPSSPRIARLCSPSAGTAPILAANASEPAGGSSAGTGPAGVSTSRQRSRAAQLRVGPEPVHVVDARVGDPGRVEPAPPPRPPSARRSPRRSRPSAPPGWRRGGRSSRSARRRRAPAARSTSRQNAAHSRSFCSPSITVPPSPAGNGPYGKMVAWDAPVRGGRRRALEGVVEREAHPLAQRLEHRDLDAAARGRCARAAAARPGCRCRRTCRPRCRRWRCRPSPARPGVPVTERKPASLWISRS